jgi:hypothetical protein
LSPLLPSHSLPLTQCRTIRPSFQGSSIGSYTTNWMNEFYISAQGNSAEDFLDKPKKSRDKLSYPPVKILFPSLTTVRESKLGELVRTSLLLFMRMWMLTWSDRVVVPCFVGEISGKPPTFHDTCFTIPRAMAGRCSCIRRYVALYQYHCYASFS